MHLFVDFKLTSPFCCLCRDLDSLSRPLLSSVMSHRFYLVVTCLHHLLDLMSRQLNDVATFFLLLMMS